VAVLGAGAAWIVGCGPAAAPPAQGKKAAPPSTAVREEEKKAAEKPAVPSPPKEAEEKKAPAPRPVGTVPDALKRIVFSDGMSVTGIVLSRRKGRLAVRTMHGTAAFPLSRVARVEDAPRGSFAAKAGKGAREGLEAEAGWKLETWGNRGEVIRDREWNGNIRLRVQAAGGTKDKTAVCLRKAMDLSGARKLVFDVLNLHDEPVKIAAAVMTGPGWEYFESRLISVPPGWRRDVEVDLKAAAFKCQATGWKFEAVIKNPAQATHFFFLVYNKDADVEVLLDRVRFE